MIHDTQSSDIRAGAFRLGDAIYGRLYNAEFEMISGLKSKLLICGI